MTRPEILDTAKKCVCGDREQDYGTPESNFSTIAELWTAYKGLPFTAVDVAIFLSLVKIGRIASGHGKADNWIDLAGYAACGGEIELNIPAYSHTSMEHEANAHKPTQAKYEELFAEVKPTVSVLESVEPVKGKYDGLSDYMLQHLVCNCFSGCLEGCPLDNYDDNCRFDGWRKIAIDWLNKQDGLEGKK